MIVKKRKEIFTNRDIEVLDYISIGYANFEIAQELGVPVSTINNVILNMLRKTNTVNRTHLVRWGFEHHYLK